MFQKFTNFVDETGEDVKTSSPVHQQLQQPAENRLWSKLKPQPGGLVERLMKLNQSRRSELAFWRHSLDANTNNCSAVESVLKMEIHQCKLEFGILLCLCRNTAGDDNAKVAVVLDKAYCSKKYNLDLAGKMLLLYPPTRIFVRKNLSYPVYFAWKFVIEG